MIACRRIRRHGGENHGLTRQMETFDHMAEKATRASHRVGGRSPAIDPYRVMFVVGALMLVLTLLMIPPMLADLVANNPDWQVFAGSALITGFIGAMMVLISRDAWSERVRLKEGFVITVASWLTLSVFAAIPFVFMEKPLDFTDAWFEAVSGLTTTGATVLTGLDGLPEGLLLWRSLTQWVGGLGIVVMALIMLPFLRVGGMQLFQTESSDRSDKIMPHARQFISWLAFVYVLLTAMCALAYRLAGMRMFDAVNHAMTTLSTGGFSTHDASFAYFTSPVLHWICIVFMITGSLPLVIYVRMIRERKPSFFGSEQVHGFLTLLLMSVLIIALWLIWQKGMTPAEALRLAAFNVTSVITTTGYATADYSGWGVFAMAAFLVFMFFGGCTGSTAGGMKIFRIQVMMMSIAAYVKRLVMPHRVVSMAYENRTVTQDIAMAVFAYVSVLFMTVGLFGMLVALTGVDLVTALSAVITAVTNVGPGLGEMIGPAGTFRAMPDAAKVLLSIAMLLGRLEFFTVLVVLQPSFWR